MNDTLDAIRTRIRKLLAVARDPAAAKGEAQNAMTFAARLMSQYNLAEADLGEDDTPRPDGYPDTQVPSLSKRAILWEILLARLCAKASGPVYVVHFITPDRRRKKKRQRLTASAYRFFGPSPHHEVAAELFDGLRQVIVTSCLYGGVIVGPGRDYADGFVAGLTSTMESQNMPAGLDTRIAVRVNAIEQWLNDRSDMSSSETRFNQRKVSAEHLAGFRDGQAHGLHRTSPKLT